MISGLDSRGGDLAALAPGFRRAGARAAVAIAAVVLAAAPALAARSVKAPKQRFSLETTISSFQPPATDPANFSFTAPGAPPSRLQSAERAFRFTPSGQADNRKALSFGVTSRVVAAAVDRSRAAAPVDPIATQPVAYDVDLSLAWRGFALNTGFSRADPGALTLVPGRRDAVDLGVSYRGRNWQTTLQGTAEDRAVLYAPLERRYSVALGGAYLVAPRLSVTGGVRYRLAPDAPSLLDPDRADQSVYFGTNFAF